MSNWIKIDDVMINLDRVRTIEHGEATYVTDEGEETTGIEVYFSEDEYITVALGQDNDRLHKILNKIQRKLGIEIGMSCE